MNAREVPVRRAVSMVVQERRIAITKAIDACGVLELDEYCYGR